MVPLCVLGRTRSRTSLGRSDSPEGTRYARFVACGNKQLLDRLCVIRLTPVRIVGSAMHGTNQSASGDRPNRTIRQDNHRYRHQRDRDRVRAARLHRRRDRRHQEDSSTLATHRRLERRGRHLSRATHLQGAHRRAGPRRARHRESSHPRRARRLPVGTGPAPTARCLRRLCSGHTFVERAEELLDVVSGAQLWLIGAHVHLGVRQRSTHRFVNEEERRAERIGGVSEVT